MRRIAGRGAHSMASRRDDQCIDARAHSQVLETRHIAAAHREALGQRRLASRLDLWRKRYPKRDNRGQLICPSIICSHEYPVTSMSRAFVKESDAESALDEAPLRARSPFPNYVTPNGLASLHARLRELQLRRRGLEGLDDLAARQELIIVDRDLRYCSDRINSAILVEADGQPGDRVHFGAAVDVAVGGEGDLRRFVIVGEDEADAAAGKISWISPLAKVLLNVRVGDWVTWRRPAGDLELEIVAIHKGGGASADEEHG